MALIRMKKLLFILFTLTHIQTQANMANPVFKGTLGSRPFVNQYVDIIHEDLLIKIDDSFEFAQFNVKYHINSLETGVQIPFLFYASEFLDSFMVKIDGQEILIQEIPRAFKIPEGTKFKDFSYFFEKRDHAEFIDVLMEDSPSSGFHINLHHMIYFETDISKGEHMIEVAYRATKWVDGWDRINEYSFRYALSPAKYWKSFGTLDLTLDAIGFSQPLNTNLGPPSRGRVDSIANWHFNKLPTEILQISYSPALNSKAQTLLKIGASGLAYITGFILMIIHVGMVFWFRKRNIKRKYSLAVIIGSIIIPLIFVISWMNYYDLIDHVIGEHASRSNGYTFFVILLYPVVLPFYWVVFWLIDKQIKKKYALA